MPSLTIPDDSSPSEEDLQNSLSELEMEKARRRTEFKLSYFQAYPKQKKFMDAGATHRERLLLGGNRTGKTEVGAAEMAFHLTGLYPQNWLGKRFDKPVRAWAAGVTNESARDVVQEKLMGPPVRRAEWGTGMIPKHCLGEVSMARGTADAIDSVAVKHVSGGYSQLQFKSYAEGREKWQGVGLEVCWMDEEPPEALYFEALSRTNETGGIVYITATPLLGMTTIVRTYLHEGAKL